MQAMQYKKTTTRAIQLLGSKEECQEQNTSHKKDDTTALEGRKDCVSWKRKEVSSPHHHEKRIIDMKKKTSVELSIDYQTVDKRIELTSQQQQIEVH